MKKGALDTLHGLTTSAKHEQVHAAVQEKYEKTEGHLKLPGQPRGVKERQNVVLDESGLVSRSSARFPEPVLQGRKRADPAGEFNQGSPTRRGKVEPYHPPPYQNQESAEQDKQNEREMKKNQEVGQPVIERRRHSLKIIESRSPRPAGRDPRLSVLSCFRRANVRP